MSLLFKGYISGNLHKAALSQPENIYSHRSDHLAYFQAKKKKPKTKAKAKKTPQKTKQQQETTSCHFYEISCRFSF